MESHPLAVKYNSNLLFTNKREKCDVCDHSYSVFMKTCECGLHTCLKHWFPRHVCKESNSDGPHSKLPSEEDQSQESK